MSEKPGTFKPSTIIRIAAAIAGLWLIYALPEAIIRSIKTRWQASLDLAI
jgi:hypothetical protein